MAGRNNVTGNMTRVAEMQAMDQNQYMLMERRRQLHQDAQLEMKNTKYNMNKLQENWLKVMRSAKTKQLKKQVEIISQNHDRDVDRKDALLQMLDRDLDEAEEQHQVSVRSHLLNVDRLLEVQQSRLLALEDDFQREVAILQEEYRIERQQVKEKHALEKRELTLIVEQVEQEEKNREQSDLTEHLSQYEFIKNRNIEDDHQMRQNLADKIDKTRQICKEKLQQYQTLTEGSNAEYRQMVARDAELSQSVEQRLRQVERITHSITHWKMKIQQNRQESEERNVQLKQEKEHIQKHFQDLKAKMTKMRSEEKRRLQDLAQDARNCLKSLKDQLSLAEQIIKTAELCRKFETEREKVLPCYISRDLVEIFEEGGIDFDEATRDEIRMELTDVGVDEWTYLDNFFKRYNKVKLDHLAIERERERLGRENTQLRSILKQFLDGVSVNQDVLSQANPLLVVNGRVNLNHVPQKRIGEKKVHIEAAHAVTAYGIRY